MVAEACSGLQSLFTILFLAALVFCLKRRSLIHGLCLLSFGLILSGMMNILRVVTIAVAWEVNGTDLSTGWPHDTLGYLCLGLAAAMLLSADRLLEFLLDPLLDVRRHGGGSLYFNPLIAAWNKVFTVLPVADPKEFWCRGSGTRQRTRFWLSMRRLLIRRLLQKMPFDRKRICEHSGVCVLLSLLIVFGSRSLC
jgi:exosortase/archaeosortase family protein